LSPFLSRPRGYTTSPGDSGPFALALAFLKYGHTRLYTQLLALFKSTTHLPYQGFRNPYLGWTEESLQVFTELGFAYESNEAVLHDVIDLANLPPPLRSGYEKSLGLQ